MVGRFEWERALRADPGVPWHVKAFLLYVGTYMSADGADARPSVPRIVRETGLSRSRVFELLQAGEAVGWLRTVPQKGKTSLRMPAVPSAANPSDTPDPSDPPDPLRNERGPTHRTQGSGPPDGRGPTHRTQQSQDNTETTHTRARAGFDACVDYVLDGFERIDERQRYDRRDVTDSVSGFLRGQKVTDPLAFVRTAFERNPEQFRPVSMPPRYQRQGPAA